jgi:hypothetical protein
MGEGRVAASRSLSALSAMTMLWMLIYNCYGIVMLCEKVF